MNLSEEFTKALEGTIEVSKVHNYSTTYFVCMLAESGGFIKSEHYTKQHKIQHDRYNLFVYFQ